MHLTNSTSVKKVLIYLVIILAIIFSAAYLWLTNANNHQRSGTIDFHINEAPIQVYRDAYGIPYIHGENKADVIKGQGFITAQDRLFFIEFYRAIIAGRAAAIVGNSMLDSDIQMRVLDMTRLGKRTYSHLREDSRQFLQWYCDGYNAYLNTMDNEFPLELSLLGMVPTLLTAEEMVAIIHFVGYSQSQNMDDEILSLNLLALTNNDTGLLPLNINPDRNSQHDVKIDSSYFLKETDYIGLNETTPPSTIDIPNLGSNNWAVSPAKAENGKVMVGNDPHLDARLLPGIFHPIGLSCPSFTSVGVAIPGVPGLIIGRNEHMAFGVTNAYGDSQDLCIEKINGHKYLSKDEWADFTVREEIIKVKDAEYVTIKIRATVNGPVISDFESFGIKTDEVVTLSWSPAHTTSPSLGLENFLESKTVYEFKQALYSIDNLFFNFIFGDKEDNIAHQTTGLVPIRRNQHGAIPHRHALDGKWEGFIPKEEMPHMINPERAWVGTANHDPRTENYPYYYSAHFSTHYRYSRIKEIMETTLSLSTEDGWDINIDCKNMQAQSLLPLIIPALQSHEETLPLAEELAAWNLEDKVDLIGPTIYNTLYDILARELLADDIPEKISTQFWDKTYFWSQRVDKIMFSPSDYIDNKNTDKTETLNDVIISAGLLTKEKLNKVLGPEMSSWQWGNIHTIRFASPIKQTGFGSSFLGAEEFPKNGSNNTLNRAGYLVEEDGTYTTQWLTTFRMVADLSDDEKMIGVLAGGSSSRILHPYYKSQLTKWKNEAWIPYWLDSEKVRENSKFHLVLE